MKYSVNFSIITFYIAHMCVGYRRSYSTPTREDWGPTMLPVEEVQYSVVSAPLSQGGALHWDAAENVLYFADVTGQTLYRYDPATTVQKSIKFDSPVSLVIPIKGQKHHTVVGLDGEMVILRWYWDSGNFSTTHFASVDSQRARSRWNSGRADVLGRIWAESETLANSNNSSKAASNLYLIDTAKTCRIDSKLSDLDLSSGLAWSPDNKVFYHASPSRIIKAFDFNIDSGLISNPRTVFDYGDLPGLPAGLAVDKDGNLWIASFGGSQVIQINPTNGKLLRQLKMPVKQVTSIVFGGPSLEDFYVASARTGDDGGEGGLEGAVLKITDLNEGGVPLFPAVIVCKPCNDKVDTDSTSWWCTADN